MADTPTTTDTTASQAIVTTDTPVTPPATTPAATRVTFTAEQQEEVNRIASRAREEGKQSAQRRAEPPKSQPTASTQHPTAEAPSGLSLADVQRMIAREGDFVTALTGAGLDDDQKRSVRALFVAANPDDVGAWWKDTIEPLKLGKQPAPPATTPPVTQTTPQQVSPQETPTQPAVPPVSDRGAPPAPKVPLEEAYLPTMSQSDRDALIKTKGARWYMDQLTKQLRGKSIDLRRR